MQKNKILFILIFISLSTAFALAQQGKTITLTLNDAIEIALENGPQMKLLKLDVIGARENLVAAKGRFKTNAQLSLIAPNFTEQLSGVQQGYGFTIYNTMGSYTYAGNLNINQPLPTDGVLSLSSSLYHMSEFYLTLADTDTTTRRFSSSLSLRLAQPLFGVNQLKNGLRRAELNYETTMRRFNRTELDIVYNVTQAFYSLYNSTRQKEISEDQAIQQEQTYTLAKKKFKAGLIPEVEVLQMEVDLAASRNSLLSSRGVLKRETDSFKQFIGLPLDVGIKIQTNFDFQILEIDSVKAVEEAIKNNLDIRSTEISIELAEMTVKETNRKRYISGELSAFYNFSGISDQGLEDTGLGSLFQSSFNDLRQRPRNRGFSLQLSVPLWDWGVRDADLTIAKLGLESARINLKENKKSAVLSIVSTLEQVKEAENRLDVLKKSEAVAQKSYEITLHRFENGDITSQDLVLDQQRLANAKRAYLDAFISYKIAIADLTRKTMYDFEKGKSLVK